MLIATLLFACGLGTADSPVSGCWEALPKRTTIECFDANGSYTLRSATLGDFDGTWELDGTELTLAVGGMKADAYQIERKGDRLVLTNPKRSLELVRHEP